MKLDEQRCSTLQVTEDTASSDSESIAHAAAPALQPSRHTVVGGPPVAADPLSPPPLVCPPPPYVPPPEQIQVPAAPGGGGGSPTPLRAAAARGDGDAEIDERAAHAPGEHAVAAAAQAPPARGLHIGGLPPSRNEEEPATAVDLNRSEAGERAILLAAARAAHLAEGASAAAAAEEEAKADHETARRRGWGRIGQALLRALQVFSLSVAGPSGSTGRGAAQPKAALLRSVGLGAGSALLGGDNAFGGAALDVWEHVGLE